eukprot:TRINITY_DN3087_c0_g2_i1.p1 TRINITY_DN3087_c0_g2~~TRINITY_DN3087_c0_g2_i1.p1  ORF type:complete len:296 (-),score=43.54 TRINITY_DN3087_c0_g2_i1:148-1035(-)
MWPNTGGSDRGGSDAGFCSAPSCATPEPEGAWANDPGSLEIMRTRCMAEPKAHHIRQFLAARAAISDLLGGSDMKAPTAGYMRRKCRATRPGSGGAPLCPARPPCDPPAAGRTPRPRPMSAPSSTTRSTKTEQWRETGQIRWPKVDGGERLPEKEDVVPFRRFVPNQQSYFGNTLWLSSLREPGVALQDPLYANIGGTLKEISDEWRDVPPYKAIPYSGSTTIGRAAMPRDVDPKKWIERPVATGKYALDHHDGTRYAWDATPRPCLTELEREPAPPAPKSPPKRTKRRPHSARY